MKNLLLATLSVLIILGSTAYAQDKQYKFKAKADWVTLRDKSEGSVFVRRELEAMVSKRLQAVKNKDAEAQVAQISLDYSATQPNGQTLNYEQNSRLHQTGR